MLQVGTLAPDFELTDQNGKMHTLKEYRGKKVILYFYSKDNTPGCTKQACAYNSMLSVFADRNTVIIGISKDSTVSHSKFQKKYNLRFTLLSDPERDVIEAYDVLKEKKNYGTIYLGILRTTYLIDEHGVIQYANDKVRAAEDAELMLKLQLLQ